MRAHRGSYKMVDFSSLWIVLENHTIAFDQTNFCKLLHSGT